MRANFITEQRVYATSTGANGATKNEIYYILSPYKIIIQDVLNSFNTGSQYGLVKAKMMESLE